MLVKSVLFQSGAIDQTVRLRESAPSKAGNTFTVINGENGSGKSALLRIISDAALGLDSSRSKLFARDVKLDSDGHIARVIALSGTHNDRFPLNSGIEFLRTSNQFDQLPFYYFGPKHSGNITSVSKASNTIAHSVLADEQHPFFPGKQLRRLFDFLKLKPRIEIDFDLGIRLKNDRGVGYFSDLEDRRKLTGDLSAPNKLSTGIAAAIAIASRLSEIQYSRRSKESILRVAVDIENDWQRNLQLLDTGLLYEIVFGDGGSISQLIADLVSIGALTTKISLRRVVDGSTVRLDDLSSGEWQLLYTLMNLAVNCQPESLVLIDEPENSLHPQWQTEYISLVRELTSHVDGCHVIVATHSPLIAASIMPSDGNLVSLSRSFRSGGRFVAKNEDNAYGWLPSDVLQERFDVDSARPPELTEAINEALALLRVSSEPTDELRSIAERIKGFKESLPLHDPLSPVLEAIVDIAFPDTAERVDGAD